jgi:hypothetical protein
MMDGLRKLFGKPKHQANDAAWLQQFGAADIYAISATASDGIDASNLTQDQLLAEIRQALERDQENRKKGYNLFTYSASDQRRLPFFTDNDHAQKFCGEYSKEKTVYFRSWCFRPKARCSARSLLHPAMWS